jgi:hypothetical protein
MRRTISGVVWTALGAAAARTPPLGDGVLPDHRRQPDGTGLQDISSQGPGWATLFTVPARNSSSSWGRSRSRHILNIWICIGPEVERGWVGRVGERNAVTRRGTNGRPCYRHFWFGQIVLTENVPTRRNSDPPPVTASAGLDNLSRLEWTNCPDSKYSGVQELRQDAWPRQAVSARRPAAALNGPREGGRQRISGGGQDLSHLRGEN